MSLLDGASKALGGRLPGLPDASALTSLLSSFASAFVQTTRLLKLTFAEDSGIPSDLLLPHRLTGREALNEGFRYELEALSSDASIELKTLLGVPARVTILTDGGDERMICGLVTEVSQAGSDGGFAVYRLVIESALAVLKHRRTCRVFTKTDVKTLTLKLLQEHLDGNPVLGASFGIDDRCRTEYPERPFWMQYNETDEMFLRRLWAREGISFLVLPEPVTKAEEETEGQGEPPADAKAAKAHPQHTLILFDEPLDLDADTCGSARFHRADGTEEKDSITEWKARRILQPGSVSRAAWNHTSASAMASQHANQVEQGNHGQALASTLEDYQDHGHLEDDEAALLDPRALARMKSLEGKAKHFEGEGTLRTFKAGSWFTLTEHPVHDQDPDGQRDFLITSLETTAVNNLPKDLESGLPALLLKGIGSAKDTKPEPPCRNAFTCVRRGIPVLPPEIAPPRPGLLSARVVGPEDEEIHVDELHRIKVRFLFTRGEEHAESGASGTDADSAWVRLSQMWSSQGFGSSFIPRAGDEVLIQFLHGDPDKPLVAGCLSNGLKTPAAFSEASSLPADKTLSGIRSRMVKGTGGNELIFDDTPQELRARLACDHLASQLNLGYLVKPRCGGASVPLGEGFELRTQGWGALRTAKGMLLATDGGLEDHLANAPLASQVGASIELSKTLSDVAGQHQADTLEAIPATEGLKRTLDATRRQGSGAKARQVAAFDRPVLALSSPTGIVAATPSNQAVAAQEHLHAATGKDVNLTVGGRLAMAVKDTWSVFTSNAGMKLLAGKRDIALRAHEGQLNATADQALKVTAIKGTLELLAKNGITLATPGATFQVKDGEVNIEGSTCNVHCITVNQMGLQKADVPLPSLPKGEPKDVVASNKHSFSTGGN